MKEWITYHYDFQIEKIVNRYGISEMLAEALVNRGLFDWKSMDQYVFPDMECQHNFSEMKDGIETASILEEKIKEGKKIKIIGDYDVDGVMSTYILYRGIEMLGGKATYRIPHRVCDGYGIRDYMVTEAKEEGCDTIITCDNGISAVDAVNKAKELGMTILITDHHEVPLDDGEEVLPPADTVVDPKQKACQYPYKNLCGAGIAYKLMRYLFQKNGIKNCEEELLPFAAAATVCDVVPLLGENRILVKNGLEYLKKTTNKGMRALIEAMELSKEISSYDLGFRIGPCINAAGRLDDARRGVELLLEQDEKAVVKKACELVELNNERKNYTAKATEQAIAIIESGEMANDRVLVIYLKDCLESVAGIVAGRICEKYYRPAMILTKGKKGVKGSARSIDGYHVQKELNRCKDLLLEYGGHAKAAGFSLLEENVDRFRKQLNENCTLTDEDLIEKVYYDREVPLAEININTVLQLNYMEPYGEENRAAIFLRENVVITSVFLCGKEKQVGILRIKDGNRLYDGVDFQCEQHIGEAICERYGEKTWEDLKQGRNTGCKVDILYKPSINDRNGNVQFQIEDCR